MFVIICVKAQTRRNGIDGNQTISEIDMQSDSETAISAVTFRESYSYLKPSFCKI